MKDMGELNNDLLVDTNRSVKKLLEIGAGLKADVEELKKTANKHEKETQDIIKRISALENQSLKNYSFLAGVSAACGAIGALIFKVIGLTFAR